MSDEMTFFDRLAQSRWRWLLEGLPSVSRASALFRVRRHTMTSPARCKHLWNTCNQVIDERVDGDFVECGVWKGGSAGLMGLVLKFRGETRAIHLFDSFEGLPEPTIEDGARAAEYSGGRASGALQSVDKCRAGSEEVRDFLFGQLDLDDKLVKFHVGWFQDSVPKIAPTLGPISILRLDGDWYESTRICLEFLYPLVSSGGIVILDDYYCWQGCAKAAEEFRSRSAIKSPIHRIDRDAAFWKVDRS
jgi:O-methyltransferase